MAHISAQNICLHYPVHQSMAPRLAEHPEDNRLKKGKKSNYIEALSNISFEINSGDRIALLGTNGCGKSTLLRILGGIYEPTGGTLKIDGETSSLFNINLGVRPDSTGRENIYLRGIIRGLKRRVVKEKVDEIVEFSELGDFIDMPVRTYSAGMAMRLSFAIATSFSPEILLLDEWIGAGDQKFQEKAAKRMHKLVDQSGITLLASHNRPLIRQVCDKAIWLDKGVMRAVGAVDEVYRKMDA